MLYNRLRQFKPIYHSFLPFAIPVSSGLGFAVGLNTSESNKPICVFIHTIGYISIGFFTGILYPISLPLSTAYVVYKSLR